MGSGKTIIITGASSGIGLEMTRAIAGEGHTVVMACRNKEKTAAIRAEMQKEKDVKLDSIPLDLASFASIRGFVREFQSRYQVLHGLINNAGAFFHRLERTEEGFEMTMGVNYLGPFYLTGLLLPTIQRTPKSRIIFISSRASFFTKLQAVPGMFSGKTRGFRAYARSKLALNLFAIDLAEQLAEHDCTVNTVFPGRVATNIWRGKGFLMKLMNPIMMRSSISAAEGAETGIYLALSEEVEGITGKLFEQKKSIAYNEISLDEKLRKRLMLLSFDAINVKKGLK